MTSTTATTVTLDLAVARTAATAIRKQIEGIERNPNQFVREVGIANLVPGLRAALAEIEAVIDLATRD